MTIFIQKKTINKTKYFVSHSELSQFFLRFLEGFCLEESVAVLCFRCFRLTVSDDLHVYKACEL